MTSIAPTHRVSFFIGDEHNAKSVVDALTEIFFEGQAVIAAFERPDGRWDVTAHFAEAPDQALVRELVTKAAGAESQTASPSTRSRPRIGSRPASKTSSPCPPDASSCTASMIATVSPQQARHRNRGRAGVRHRSPRHHARLPFAARSCPESLASAARARSRHRHRCAGDRGRQGADEKVLGSDIDPPSVQVARENARLNVAGHLVQAVRATGFRPRNSPMPTVRPGAGEHSGQSAAATGRADGAASVAIGAGHSVGTVDASGARRHRRLSRPRAGAATALRIEGWSSLLLRKVN